LFLPKNSPQDKPQKATEFYLDNQNIDEVSNPHFKRYVADQQYIRSVKENHRTIYQVWKLTSNCGRSMLQWMFISAILAFAFGVGYYFMGGSICFNQDSLTRFFFGKSKPSFFGCIYYSVVTFTTLGFGDIIPVNDLARFVVMLEVILGYIMLGGLISIFSNKLARRSWLESLSFTLSGKCKTQTEIERGNPSTIRVLAIL